FTTASSPADAAAALAAVRVVRSPEGDALKARLRANVDRLRPGHPSPVVPYVCGSEARALDAAAALAARGFLVTAIRPPTVPPGTSRLRVAVSADHTADQVDGLAAALIELFPDDSLPTTPCTRRHERDATAHAGLRGRHRHRHRQDVVGRSTGAR